MWNGKVSARHVLVLVGHLSFIPASRVRMIRRTGDPREIGWDIHADIAADRFDQMQAIVSGFGSSKKAPDFYPRPGERRGSGGQEAEKPAPTIADFNVGAFMQEVHN